MVFGIISVTFYERKTVLIKASIKKPVTVLVGILLVIALGAAAFVNMTPDLLPAFDLPYVVVVTTYQGAAPEKVEENVTAPVEKQLATLEGLKNINSVSAENYSMIILEFESETDLSTVSSDIRDKIGLVSGTFDDSVGSPTIMKMNPNMIPVSVAAVSRKGSDLSEISKLVENDLQRQLEGTDGVASVLATGLVDKNIVVHLDQKKINSENARLKKAMADQYGSGESQIRQNINSAQNQQSQLSSSKAKIVQQQKTVAEAKAGGMEVLSQIQTLVAAREELEKNGLPTTDIDNRISSAMKLLTPYKALFRQFGIDINSVDDSSISATNAKVAFGAGCDTMLSELANASGEVAAGQGTLTALIAQLQSSLAQLESSKSTTLDSFDLAGQLTKDNIAALLEGQNIDMPAGYIDENGSDLMVTVGDNIKDIDDLKQLVIADTGLPGVDPVRLGDVADISYISSDGETYAKVNGEDALFLTFMKQSDASTAKAADNIKEEFTKLESDYDGLSFDILSDQGEYIDMAINAVLKNILLGAVLAILILLYFLRDWKPTLVTALAIPISFIFAIVLMYFTGVTINVLSLAGLAVGVGMLVDNSIVVIENIYRLRSAGYSAVKAAYMGTRQVAGALTASTLTTIFVFLPIVFVHGISRELFTDMALTVAYSLLASLIIAVTMVPALGHALFDNIKNESVLARGSRSIANFRKVVEWALDHKAVVLGISVVMLVFSVGMLAGRGFEFMPGMATSRVTATVTAPEDMSKEDTFSACDKISEEARRVKGVDTVGVMTSDTAMSFTGMSSESTDYHNVTIYITMKDDYIDNAPKVAKKIESVAKKAGVDAQANGTMDISSYSSSLGGQISMYVYADDLDTLRDVSQDIEAKISSTKGVEDVSDTAKETSDEIHVKVNKSKAMKYGLTTGQVLQQVSSMLSKNVSSISVKYGGNDTDVLVTGGEGEGVTESGLQDLEITVPQSSSSQTQSSSATKVKLGDIADISRSTSLSEIYRENQKRMINITANPADGYNVTTATDNIKKDIESMNLPDGVSVEYSGMYDTVMDSMKNLGLMLLLGLLLIYLIMVSQFQSFRSPLIVMFTVPLAFTGGLLALLITGNTISVIAMIGFIMLQGVIVNNAIVLVDYLNKLRIGGMEKREAILEAACARIRPVLMTAFTTILGLMPLAMGVGNGVEMVQPVAIVCVGGMLYATLMTLIVIPVIYDIMGPKRMRVISEEELTLDEG